VANSVPNFTPVLTVLCVDTPKQTVIITCKTPPPSSPPFTSKVSHHHLRRFPGSLTSSCAQDRTKVELEDEKQRAESDFFEYVATSYRYFLAGDDRQCEQVDGAKAAEFEERADEIRAHNDAVQKGGGAVSPNSHRQIDRHPLAQLLKIWMNYNSPFRKKRNFHAHYDAQCKHDERINNQGALQGWAVRKHRTPIDLLR
jgi:hypothetical protein